MIKEEEKRRRLPDVYEICVEKKNAMSHNPIYSMHDDV